MRSILAEVWRFLVREGVLRQAVVVFACAITWEAFAWGRDYAGLVLDRNPTWDAGAIILAVQAPAAWLAKAVLEWWGKTKPETP